MRTTPRAILTWLAAGLIGAMSFGAQGLHAIPGLHHGLTACHHAAPSQRPCCSGNAGHHEARHHDAGHWAEAARDAPEALAAEACRDGSECPVCRWFAQAKVSCEPAAAAVLLVPAIEPAVRAPLIVVSTQRDPYEARGPPVA